MIISWQVNKNKLYNLGIKSENKVNFSTKRNEKISLHKLSFSLLVLFLCCTTFNTALFAQSRKDSVDLVGFAKFLYDEELYKFASEEYERLTYFFPNEVDHQILLISSLRKANLYPRIKEKVSSFDINNPKIIYQYLIAMMLNDDEDSAKKILGDKSSIIDPASFRRLSLDIEAIGNHWDSADKLYIDYNINDSGYKEIIEEGLKIKKKSPGLAGIMSTLIPGSGRIYANDWKDGLISIGFIGAMTYQSYTRFHKKGIKSVGGWIYGGIGLGFYVANIVGSVQSAKLFNRIQNKTLHAKTKTYIDRFYLD